MKKHVIIPFGVCLFLIVLSGIYIEVRYAVQKKAQKELMVWYVSDVKTKLNVILSRVRELPHIVKPILGEGDLLNTNIEKKFPDELSMFERFYVDNNYFIKGLSVSNRNGAVFNLYRDKKNGEFIRDIYISRSISKLLSQLDVVIEENSFKIVMPVYHGQTLSGNVAVDIDILSLQQELFQPYLEKGNIWPTSFLDEETRMTFPFDEEWTLSCEEEIIFLLQERQSGFFTGKMSGSGSTARVVTYFETLAIPEYHVGIAFSGNMSPFFISSILTFVVICFILVAIATAAFWLLGRMIAQNKNKLDIKDKEIHVLQIIYDNSPVAFIVSRNDIFFTANSFFYEMFKGYKFLDDDHRVNLPFTFQHEYKEWDLCTFERIGKEVTLGRKQMCLELEGDRYVIEGFWNISEIELRLKDAIRSKITKTELLSRVSADVRKTLDYVKNTESLLIRQFPEAEHYTGISKMTSELSDLVNSVQDYTNIEAGRIVLDEMPFNLIDEIKNLTEKFNDEAQRKGIELQAHIAASTIRKVVGDPQRFRQIITELLNNAVKFTHEGFVRISIETTELQKRKILIKCSVEDTGQGMPKEKLKKLFALDQLVKEQESVGLGIIITRKLVQMMGGKLRASSPSPISTNVLAPGMQFSFSIVCYSDQPHDKSLDYASFVSTKQLNVLIITSESHKIDYITNFMNRRGIQSDVFIYNKETADLLANRLIIDKSRYQFVVIVTEDSDLSFTIAGDIHRKGLTAYCLYALTDTHSQKGNYIKAKGLKMDYYSITGNDIPTYQTMLKTHFPNLLYDDDTFARIVRDDLRILVADHDDSEQKVAREIFGNLGYQIDWACDPSFFDNQPENIQYNIIFVDLDFLSNDGFEIIRMIRKKNNQVLIIAMVAALTKKENKQITKSGMDGHLLKPLNVENVKLILTKCFG